MKTVMFDPGHGGEDPGAVWEQVRESALALLIARRAKEGLRAGRSDICVKWTRDANTEVGINERARMARDAHACLFVSFHCNKVAATSARGVEIWYAKGDARSLGIARKILQQLGDSYSGLKLRGAKPDSQNRHGSLGVLQGTHDVMPAILIECGFLSNPEDRKILYDVRFGLALGRAIRAVVRCGECG